MLDRITIDGPSLVAGDSSFRAWGMNWGWNGLQPIIDYFDNPTAAKLSRLAGQLRIAQKMGANTMRVYLELGQVMTSATETNRGVLLALGRLLNVAAQKDVYLDITGNLCWRVDKVPAWYDRLSVMDRWLVQARFWKAVAATCSNSPAVLCYEMTSEPVVGQRRGFYLSEMDGFSFRQDIAPSAPASEITALARHWATLLRSAIRSEDDRPVTIGLLPDPAGPFSNMGDVLDMLVVHLYPAEKAAGAALKVVQGFAKHTKPVLLGETGLLNCGSSTFDRFLTDSSPHLVGALEFFDGLPLGTPPASIAQVLYQSGLEQFIGLRSVILKG